MILLITYDLRGPSTGYTSLYEYLKSHNGWSHYIASTWLIDTDKTPNQVVNDIKPYLQEGDNLLVVRFAKPYQGWMPKRVWKWIAKHITNKET
jgi:hypothetical protein